MCPGWTPGAIRETLLGNQLPMDGSGEEVTALCHLLHQVSGWSAADTLALSTPCHPTRSQDWSLGVSAFFAFVMGAGCERSAVAARLARPLYCAAIGTAEASIGHHIRRAPVAYAWLHLDGATFAALHERGVITKANLETEHGRLVASIMWEAQSSRLVDFVVSRLGFTAPELADCIDRVPSEALARKNVSVAVCRFLRNHKGWGLSECGQVFRAVAPVWRTVSNNLARLYLQHSLGDSVFTENP